MIKLLEQAGSKIHWTSLNDQEFAEQLRIKFREEAHEVCTASTREALIEELADVLEVMRSLGEVNNFSLQDVLKSQNLKREKHGGFDGRKFVTIAEHQEGSFGERYCLADPQKYPEVL